MFCPVGYRPAIELWDEFVAVRLAEINDSAVEGYNLPTFVAALSRGSPLDICEHIFVVSLAAVGMHASSPDGQVMRLRIKVTDGSPNLFSMTGMYGAAMYDAASAMGSLKCDRAGFLDNARFKSWDYAADENDALSAQYKAFDNIDECDKRDSLLNLNHHTLFHHIYRNTFVIAGAIPDWAKSTGAAVEVAPLISQFAGWSICVDEATYQGEWQEYLTGRKQVYSTLEAQMNSTSAGRPKLEAARAAFGAMGFEKGYLSWEAVARKIEKETGEKPSHKALRNWRDEQLNQD